MKKSTISKLLTLLVVMALTLSVAACGGNTDEGSSAQTSGTDAGQTTSGGSESTDSSDNTPAGSGVELVVNVGPDPDTIDPALNSSVDGATMIIHTFEGLLTLDENGVPIPGQAEKWDISDDGLTYTFHLRDGLKWSDGSPLTAHDFVWSWARAIDPDTAADYEYMYESIVGYEDGELAVEATDDYTLVVEIPARIPYFLELMAFPVFYPVQQATVEAGGDAWATKVDSYIGNGPYKMSEWVTGSHITVVKNENYWNYDALGPDSIKFMLMDDPNAMLAGFRAGDLMFIDDVPADEIQALKGDSEFVIESQLGTYYVSFNTQNEHLSDPRLRQALTLAIDRNYLADDIRQMGEIPAGAFVSPNIADATPGSEFRAVGGDYYDPYDYEGNLAEAKAIIEELYPDGNVPRFEYITNPSSTHELVAQALQQMWAEIGIELTVGTQEWGVFLQTRKNGEYEIARNGWLIDYNDPMGMLDLFITDGGNNDGQWSNSEYDALIAAAKSSNDAAERMQLMHDAEDILMGEWVMAPLFYYADMFMLSSSIDGFYTSPFGYKYFMYASID